MPKYVITFVVCAVTTSDNLFAQSLPSIQLDRPDQTECPFITPAKYIQIENGITFEKYNNNLQTFTYPSTLWKYGVNEKFELRLITELNSVKKNKEAISGLNPITVGFKTALFEEDRIIPKTSFIGHISTAKIGSKGLQTSYIAPSFRFTMQHTLSGKVSLAYNLGAEWNGEDAEETYIYTLTTGISLSNKLGYYLELYGFLPRLKTDDHRADSGFTYLFNNNLIADLSGGIGLSKNSPKAYVSLGLSYRFKAIR